MSQKNLLHSGLVMPLCLLILIVCCACKPAGKETVEVGGLWPSYSLPAAVSAADYVVFGARCREKERRSRRLFIRTAAVCP